MVRRQAPDTQPETDAVTLIASDAEVIHVADRKFRVLWGGAGTAGTDWNEDFVRADEDPDTWFSKTGYEWPPEERRKFGTVWPQVTGEEPDRPQAFDIAKAATDVSQRPMLIQDLLGDRGILFIAAEEGGGKSTAVEQMARELLLQRPVWGFFEPGDVAPERILIVHTEMHEPEVREQATSSERRGLSVEEDQLYVLCVGGLDLAKSADDRNFVESEIQRLRPQMIIIDSASNAVMRPQEDEDVRSFFNWLGFVLARLDVRGAVLVGHPRKQGQERSARRFDDLFGSREWKGRVSKALWMEGERMDVWKDRGGHLGLRLGRRAGKRYPGARLERPGFNDPGAIPFRVSDLLSDAELAEQAKEEVLHFVTLHPAEHTKTNLAVALKGNKQARLAVINELIAEGRLGPDRNRAKLEVQRLSSEQ